MFVEEGRERESEGAPEKRAKRVLNMRAGIIKKKNNRIYSSEDGVTEDEGNRGRKREHIMFGSLSRPSFLLYLVKKRRSCFFYGFIGIYLEHERKRIQFFFSNSTRIRSNIPRYVQRIIVQGRHLAQDVEMLTLALLTCHAIFLVDYYLKKG